MVLTALVTSLVCKLREGVGGDSTPTALSAKGRSSLSKAGSVLRSEESRAGGDEICALQNMIENQAGQIKKLESQLAKHTKLPVRMVSKSVQKPRESYMSQLQRDDPERHQRIQERLRKMQAETVQAIAESAEFLFNLDMALMTGEQAENHQKLLNLMEDSWKQADLMKEVEGAEAVQAKAKLRRNVMDMSKLYKTERRTALEQSFQLQGFTAEEARGICDEIDDIYIRTDPAEILPGTHFIGENMMISVETMNEGNNSHSIMLNMGALEMPADKKSK